MKAKPFKHQNVVFAEDQPEYKQLPALRLKTNEGQVIFCMGLSFWERMRVLILGEVWVTILSFNKALSPSFISTNKKDHYSHPDFKINQFKQFFDLGAYIYLKTNLKKIPKWSPVDDKIYKSIHVSSN